MFAGQQTHAFPAETQVPLHVGDALLLRQLEIHRTEATLVPQHTRARTHIHAQRAVSTLPSSQPAFSSQVNNPQDQVRVALNFKMMDSSARAFPAGLRTDRLDPARKFQITREYHTYVSGLPEHLRWPPNPTPEFVLPHMYRRK